MLQTIVRFRVKSDISISAPSFTRVKRKIMTRCTCRTKSTAPIESDNNFPAILKNTFLEAVRSVQPAELIRNQVKLLDRHLVVADEKFQLNKPCHMVGFGKAVLGMAVELESTLGNHLEKAVVTVPKGIFKKYPEFEGKSKKIQFIEGAEDNIPDKEAVEGALKIKELVEKLQADDFLIVLISGGGSALLPLPKPPITLEEKQNIIKNLSKGGASIQELNTVRKQLSILKGGGLAKLAFPCKVVSLILSDVVGDPLDLIASGPTVFSDEGTEKAIEILQKYSLYENTPLSIKTVLESPKCQANQGKHGKFQSNDGKAVTPSENSNNSEEKLFPNGKTDGAVSNFIIGTNKIATRAAKNHAVKNGFQCVVMSHRVEENVDRIAKIYAALACYIVNGSYEKILDLLENVPFELEENAVQDVMGLSAQRKILLIFAGEPTVFVKGTGKGGRNQQLALAFSLELNKLGVEFRNISFLSGGTDGIDGPTDAAGAIGFSGLQELCSKVNINPKEYLNNNDSYNFFSRFENEKFLVKIGHTGTNVMDLHLLLIEPLQK